jgi:C4-dicarboxylate transporter, DctQ subunit
VLKFLDHIEEWLIATLMAAATILIFIAVVHRYASGVPLLYPYMRHIDLSWSQELCIYMFVWMAKFGAAYGVRTGIHVGVDVLINKLSPSGRRNTIIFSLLCGMLFTGIVGTLGVVFVWKIYETGQVSADLEVPMWIVYLAVPLGSYLMCFRFLQVCQSFLRTGELPHHDHTAVAGLEPEPAIPGAAR